MSKLKEHTQLTPTLGLSECTDGFWLYDTTRGMNLSMKAKTPTDAFVKALSYYQNRLGTVETELRSLRKKVDDFVEQFVDEEDEK